MGKKTKFISVLAATGLAGAAITGTYLNNWEYKTIGSLQTNKLFNANVSRDKEVMPFVLEPGAVYDPVAETVTVKNVASTKIGRYGIALAPEPASLFDPVDTVTINNFSGYWHVVPNKGLVFSVTGDVTTGGTRGGNYEFNGPYPVDFVVDATFKRMPQKFVVTEKNDMIAGTTYQLDVTNDIKDPTALSNITYTSSNPDVVTVSPTGLITANAQLVTEASATITISGDKTFLHDKPADYVINIKVVPETLSLTGAAPTLPGIYEDGSNLDSIAIDLTGVSLAATSTGLPITGTWTYKDGGTAKVNVTQDKTILVFTPNAPGIKPFEVEVDIKVMKTLTLAATSVTKTYDNANTVTKAMLNTDSLTGVNAAHPGVAIDTITAEFAKKEAGDTTVTITAITLTGAGSDRYRFATTDITLPAKITKSVLKTTDLKPKIETKINTGNSIKATDILETINGLAPGDKADSVIKEINPADMSMDIKKKIL